MNHALLLPALAGALLGKPQFRGTSTAEVRGDTFRAVTTRYELGDPLTIFDLAKAFPRQSATAVRQQTLYEITQTEERVVSAEGGKGSVKVRALDPVKGRQRWTFTDESAHAYKIRPDYFIATTTAHGCCGAQNAHRAYSLMSGKLLFPFSFHARFGMPVVLRADAFNPRGFRFLAYHNDYWPARDKDPGEDRGGVFTYASPLGVIDRIALSWDVKAAQDPASDPESITVTAGGKDVVFRGYENASEHEVSYWTEDVRKATTETQAFDGIVVTLHFPAGEAVRLPIIQDRIQISGITTVGKYIKKTSQLPTDALKKPITKP